MSDLTVFVGTFNRLETLGRCIGALERQRYPKKIVIVDNGSSHSAAANYLDALERRYTIYRMPSIEDAPEQPGDAEAHGGHGMMAVQRNYTEAFRQEYAKLDGADWFAVCDCDTAPDGAGESISVYRHLAKELSCAVGPHLSLNVHKNYPLRSAALILHARVLFRDRFLWHDGIPYTHDEIDSSFHLFPATRTFERGKMQYARVGPPYWATHTDWLIDALNPIVENESYILGSGGAASWAGRWLREWWKAWMRSPEEAFAQTQSAWWNADILANYDFTGFIFSWMLQFGHGCEQDLELSRDVLRGSVPEDSPCWEYEQHWDALVYQDDQSCLGW